MFYTIEKLTDIVTPEEEKNKSPKQVFRIESNPKSQSINFGSIIQSVLSGANTSFETSKFSIEKSEEGIRFDIVLSGTIKTKKT